MNPVIRRRGETLLQLSGRHEYPGFATGGLASDTRSQAFYPARPQKLVGYSPCFCGHVPSIDFYNRELHKHTCETSKPRRGSDSYPSTLRVIARERTTSRALTGQGFSNVRYVRTPVLTTAARTDLPQPDPTRAPPVTIGCRIPAGKTGIRRSCGNDPSRNPIACSTRYMRKSF